MPPLLRPSLVFCRVVVLLCFAAVWPSHSAAQQLSAGDIVLYAAEAPIVTGTWAVQSDTSAAGGRRLHQPDAGVKTDPALSDPIHYFDLSFNADAGKAYRLWVRGKADGDSYLNDSIHAQFDKSVNSIGTAIYRVGSTDSAEVALEGCNGVGVASWGWEDNGWCDLGPVIYFATTGTQTIRVQSREDGVSIDQIVLSPDTYLTSAPGAQKNDTTILPKNNSEVVLYAADTTAAFGNWRVEADTTAAGGEKMREPDAGVKTDPALASPTSYFDLTFAADAGKAYRLWIRGKADGNNYVNDSVHAQFDGSVNSTGTAIYRIGTSDSAEVVIEGCTGAGVSEWGWEDNGWCGLGALVYFAASGSQRIRLQSREDGLSIDQIVLSSSRYVNEAPGPTTNDGTILAKTTDGGGSSTNDPPTISFFDIADVSPSPAKAPVTMHFMSQASDPQGDCCTYRWEFGDGRTSDLRNAVHTYTTSGSFTVTLTVSDGAGNSTVQTETVAVAAPKTPPASSQVIRLLQWNIYKGRSTDKLGCCEGADLSLQARWMAAMGVDAITLQEVMGGTGGQAEAYAAKLAAATGVDWYYAHARNTTAALSTGTKSPGSSSPTAIGYEGVAIISRHPLSQVASTILDSVDPPHAPRATVGATVVVNGRTIAIISAHFSCCSAGANDRLLESEDLNSWSQSTYAEPRVIMGDLNATSGSTEVKEFTVVDSTDSDSGQYEDAWIRSLNDSTGSTATAYPSNGPSASTWTHSTRIDYVLFSRNSTVLEVLAAQVPDTRDWTDPDTVEKTVGNSDDNAVRASDHNAVIVLFAVK